MATKLTWLGHGSWSIESDGHTVLLDPFLDDNPSSPVKAADVSAQYILVSHGHYDHVADVASIAKRCDATVVSNFEICEWFSAQGVQKLEPMNLGGSIELPFGRVKSTLAWHSSSLPDGANGGNPGGFVVSFPAGRVYFACDTALFSDMRLIGQAGIDLAVLPLGDRYTMGPDDALEAVKLIAPRRVVPAHYDTWPPIAQDALAWAGRVRESTSAEPVVLNAGQVISL